MRNSLFRKILVPLCFVSFIASFAFAGPIEIYFGPNGGFSKVNNSRVFTFKDGTTKTASLESAFLYELDKTAPGSTVKVCMYSMSDYEALAAMIKTAKDKSVHFKLLLDGAASWSASSRNEIVKRVSETAEIAKKEGKSFDFQIAFVSEEAMKRNGRQTTLDDGRVIWGSMHEKFGIFYKPDDPVPYTSFCGSSNISPTSDKIYAENRVFFYNQPAVAREFQEEFAVLWNEYSTSAFGKWIPETYIKASIGPDSVRVITNSRHIDETHYSRVDNELLNIIRNVDKNGSLDLTMFSLTRLELAQAILRSAARNASATFRLMLNHSQLDGSDPKTGILAPWIEEQAKEQGLTNIKIRYRFRRNAYGYDSRAKKIGLVSFKSLFLHHKTLIVNKNLMALGSYNWSNAAEFMNLENVMIFNGKYKSQQKVIDDFLREFNVLWNSRVPYGPVLSPRKGVPQTVTGDEGRRLQAGIIKLLSSSANLKVKDALDREAFKTFAQLKKETKLSTHRLKSSLRKLVKAGMLCRWKKDGLIGYSQAD